MLKLSIKFLKHSFSISKFNSTKDYYQILGISKTSN